MKKVAKVKTGKKKSEPKEATLGAATLRMVQGARRDVMRGCEAFSRVLDSLKGEATVPQAVLACAVELDEAASEIGDTRKQFVTVVKEHKARGGDFEAGKVAIQISTSERVSPKWKDAAITAAKALAELKGEKWDEDEYVKEVQRDAATSESTSVKLTVSD